MEAPERNLGSTGPRKSITLSERSQSQKATRTRVPFIRNVQNGQILRDAVETGGCQGLREGAVGSNGLVGTRLSPQDTEVFGS